MTPSMWLAFENIPSDVDVPFIVYSANHIAVGILFSLLWKYVSNPKHKISIGLTDKRFMRYNYYRLLSIIVVFSITIVLCCIKPGISRMFTILAAFVIPVLNRLYGYKG